MKPKPFLIPGFASSLLSYPSKMPGPSWGLPARVSCPNSHGEVCEYCYAAKGNYRFRKVQHAQSVRFQWTRESMKNPLGQYRWSQILAGAIHESGCKYFRIHDSGDFFSIAYIESWIQVCKSLPRVRFWAPTREWQTPSPKGPFPLWKPEPNPRIPALIQLASLPNVTVRPSALGIGDKPPRIPGLAAGSMVHAGIHPGPGVKICHASSRGGHCGLCRHCWNKPDIPVSYPLH